MNDKSFGMVLQLGKSWRLVKIWEFTFGLITAKVREAEYTSPRLALD